MHAAALSWLDKSPRCSREAEPVELGDHELVAVRCDQVGFVEFGVRASLPEAVSLTTRSQPATRSASCCACKCWSPARTITYHDQPRSYLPKGIAALGEVVLSVLEVAEGNRSTRR